MAFTTTSRDVIDTARTRHWSFTDLVLGDGAVLINLSQRLRTHLATHGSHIEGLVGTSVTYDIEDNAGLLIAEVSGVPQYTTTYQDGWPIHLDGAGIPYYDTSEPQIAKDPFGENGGTPGFPLPSDMVRLTTVHAVFQQSPGPVIPVDVIPAASRVKKQPSRNPAAFISGNRLVPLLPWYPSSSGVNANDRWTLVQSIIIEYVALPTLTSLDSVLNIPSVLVDALIADMALLMANQSKECPVGDKKMLADECARTAALIDDAALSIVQTPQQRSVVWNG